MRKILAMLVGGAALAAAACEVIKEDPPPPASLAVAAALTVTEDGAGGYSFRYDAPFADEKGNFDFTQGEAYGKIIVVTFTIADGSVPGLKFKPEGEDAIWIADKKNVGADGSPTGPYRGEVFHDFKVSADGRSLTVTSDNDDRTLYRYGLRFDLDGQTVIDDPDWGNDGHG